LTVSLQVKITLKMTKSDVLSGQLSLSLGTLNQIIL